MINNKSRIWVCLTGKFEEDVYTAALQHINPAQIEICYKTSQVSPYNKLNFEHVIAVGNMAINSKLAGKDKLFKGIDIRNIQHSHSMSALSDGIYDVLHDHCFYSCKLTDITPCVSCYIEESKDGLLLYNDLALQYVKDYFLYGKESVNEIEKTIDATDIRKLEFEHWIMINRINRQTICDYSLWES